MSVQLREPIGLLAARRHSPDSPVEVAALGIAYRVLNRVDRVIEGSPAAKAGLMPDDVIVEATLIPPDKETLRKLEVDQTEVSMPFDARRIATGPRSSVRSRTMLPGTTVQLTFSRQEKKQTSTLEPVEAADWFNPDRGFAVRADDVRRARRRR